MLSTGLEWCGFWVLHSFPVVQIPLDNVFVSRACCEECSKLSIFCESFTLLKWTFHYKDSLTQCNSIIAFTTNWKFWCCCIHCLLGVNEYQRLVYTHTFPFIPKYVLCFHWLYALFMNTRLVTMSASLCTQTVLHSLILQVLNTKSLLLKCSPHFCT